MGQELVEFALVLPLLLLIAFGVLDLGRAFHAAISISNAAREGARYGISHPLASQLSTIQTIAQDEAAGAGIDLSRLTVLPVTCSKNAAGDCQRGQPLTVTVRYDFDLVLGFLPDFTLERSVQMMVL